MCMEFRGYRSSVIYGTGGCLRLRIKWFAYNVSRGEG